MPGPRLKGRVGSRTDLVQLLKALRPGSVRFPGGCIVQGRDLENRYQRKNTLEHPRRITPAESVSAVAAPRFPWTLAPLFPWLSRAWSVRPADPPLFES